MSDRQPLSLDVLAARVEANQQALAGEIGKLRETLGSIRQEIAENMADQHSTNQEVLAALAELKAAAKFGKTPGPMDQEGIAEALRDSAARSEAVKEYGIQ